MILILRMCYSKVRNNLHGDFFHIPSLDLVISCPLCNTITTTFRKRLCNILSLGMKKRETRCSFMLIECNVSQITLPCTTLDDSLLHRQSQGIIHGLHYDIAFSMDERIHQCIGSTVTVFRFTINRIIVINYNDNAVK